MQIIHSWVIANIFFNFINIMFYIKKNLYFLVLVFNLFCSNFAIADMVLLENGEVLEVLFYSKLSSKQITCAGPIDNKYMSGRTVSVGSSKIFTPLNNDLKSLKSKLKSTTTIVAKNKIKKKMKKLKARVKSEDNVCSNGPDAEAPPTNPVTEPTATPRPTATSTPSTPKSNSNFDTNGNVTDQGKIAFGIPSNLSANREAGKSLHNSSCNGCHVEKTGKNFSYYKSVIRLSPMFIMDKSDQDVANITAYLRRFELN